MARGFGERTIDRIGIFNVQTSAIRPGFVSPIERRDAAHMAFELKPGESLRKAVLRIVRKQLDRSGDWQPSPCLRSYDGAMLIWHLAQFTIFVIVFWFVVPYWQYRRDMTKTPPQITIRRLFFLVTLYALLIGTLHTIEEVHARRTEEIKARHEQATRENEARLAKATREIKARHEQAIRENKARHKKALHEIAVRHVHAKRQGLESFRGRLKPEEYERRSRELDQEAEKLGVPSNDSEVPQDGL